MLLYVLAAEIMYRPTGTKRLQARVVAVDSTDPDRVELNHSDVFFRFCQIMYRDVGKEVRLAKERGGSCQLETVDGLDLVSPTGIEFHPQRFFRRANLITLEDSRSGGYLRDAEAQRWMEERGLDGCIRGSDDHYYRASHETFLLGGNAVIV